MLWNQIKELIKLKKLLIIHNKYRITGGEDIVVEQETKVLEKHFIVNSLIFSNKVFLSINKLPLFLSSKSKESRDKLTKFIDNFNPDIVLVHNTWFNASLSIFDVLKEKNIKTILKLHNFRYFCTKNFFHKNHIPKNEICSACGQFSSRYRIFNKYFLNSYIKSLMVVFYGKRYFNLLKSGNFKIVVLTKFHKKFLSKLGVSNERISVIPNLFDIDAKQSQIKMSNREYVVYGGRISEEKGIEELIKTFLSCNFHNLYLKIIGNGPSLSYLEDQYSSDSIQFVKEVSNAEMLDIISNSKGVVTATKLYEGQPTLLCEASLHAIPSVFPKSGGIEEFFPNEYPLSYNQYDYEELKDKLIYLNNLGDSNEIGKKNKEFIENYLDEKKLIKDLSRVFND